MPASSEESWTRRLLEVARAIVTELDPEVVLDRVLETARELTGARYAALGILGEHRTELSRFLTSGVDERTHRAIGDLPRGRGVLGVLIEEPRPLRLDDVGGHPRSYGFPTGHPVMRSFLGVPIAIRGETWGNLYLAEKLDGSFSEEDEQAAVILAEWAAVAIDNARLYQTSERRRGELEKAVRGLEATRDVAVAIGGEIELAPVLELIAKRGRALVGAASLVIMLREGSELVVHAGAGRVEGAMGRRLALDDSTSGQVLQRRRPERIPDVSTRLGIAAEEFGVPGARTALIFVNTRFQAEFAARRCWCRWSIEATAWGCWRRSTAARKPRRTMASAPMTSRCCAPSPPARPPRSLSPRACRPTGCAARWPPRTPSAGAGRASSTTRPCRRSEACGCCSPRRSSAGS